MQVGSKLAERIEVIIETKSSNTRHPGCYQLIHRFPPVAATDAWCPRLVHRREFASGGQAWEIATLCWNALASGVSEIDASLAYCDALRVSRDRLEKMELGSSHPGLGAKA